jgi:hypothetical protein
MTKMTTNELTQLLAAARATPMGANPEQAQEAVFKALLDATVYAHVPVESPPEGVMRFIQFVRPDNGLTVLPFFSDRTQAEQPQRKDVSIVTMSGRRLFELTRGATLMLNPNLDQIALYPPEITALLEGKELGYFARHTLDKQTSVGACLPSVPTGDLDVTLRGLFEEEQTVRAAYLVEVHRYDEDAEVFLLATIVAGPSHHERLLQLVALALKTHSTNLELPLSLLFVAPDAPLPEVCHAGIQLFGR